MTKPFLPRVTKETIQEIALQARADLGVLFTEMATSNPELYRFVYQIHNGAETNKSTMLGVVAGVYYMLEKQGQKGKKDRRRLRGQNGDGL